MEDNEQKVLCRKKKKKLFALKRINEELILLTEKNMFVISAQ